MKKLLTCMIAFAGIAAGTAHAQCTWYPLGPVQSNELSTSPTNFPAVEVDANNVPYVLYADNFVGDKATVKKFVGGVWTVVGTRGFSSGVIKGSTSIDIDSNGNPYVAFIDQSNGEKATVMKYTGTTWQLVGAVAASTSIVDALTMKLDASNNPYICFIDTTAGQKVTVRKFNGTTWQTVGTAGFSASNVGNPDLAISSSGIPFVVYSDSSQSQKATVMKYNGTAWQTVGAAGFSPGGVANTTIDLDASGNPYVAFGDYAATNYNDLTVMKFSGTSWQTVGAAGITTSYVSSPVIKLTTAGTPYVAYKNPLYKTSVLRYNGSAWQAVGTPNASEDALVSLSFAISSNNTPYVAYANFLGKTSTINYTSSAWGLLGPSGIDANFSGGDIKQAVGNNNVPYIAILELVANSGYRVKVKKWNDSTWVNVGTYADPGNGIYKHDIAISPTGVPHVAFCSDYNNGEKLSVVKFTGSSWVPVGTYSFSPNTVDDCALSFDNSGNPMVVYTDKVTNKVNVQKYNPSLNLWQQVGSANFSPTVLPFPPAIPRIAVNRITGNPVVCYMDTAIRVQEFNGTAWQAPTLPVISLLGGTARAYNIYADLTSDNAGITHVAYSFMNFSTMAGITGVSKYTGGAWQQVGAPLETTYVQNVSIKANASGDMFVGYFKNAAPDLTVQKLALPSTWQVVGNSASGLPQIEDASSTPGITLALNDAGRLYAAYANNNGLYDYTFEQTAKLTLATPVVCANTNVQMSVSGTGSPSWSGPQTFTATTSTITLNNVNPTKSGVYTVTVTGTGCASAVRSASLTVNNLPNVGIVTNSVTICSGQTAILTASGANSYTWSTNSSTNPISVTPTITTTYTVVGVNAATSCSNQVTYTQNVSTCIGIEHLSKNDPQIDIFPNPSHGQLYVNISEDAELVVMDALGKTVANKQLKAGSNDISLTGLTSGIYIAKIMTSQQTYSYSKKIIVE